MSTDPAEQHFDRFLYASSNPITRVDPDGRADIETHIYHVGSRMVDPRYWKDNYTKYKIVTKSEDQYYRAQKIRDATLTILEKAGEPFQYTPYEKINMIAFYVEKLSSYLNFIFSQIDAHKQEHEKYDLVKVRDREWGSYSGAANYLKEQAIDQGVEVDINKGKTVHHYIYKD